MKRSGGIKKTAVVVAVVVFAVAVVTRLKQNSNFQSEIVGVCAAQLAEIDELVAKWAERTHVGFTNRPSSQIGAAGYSPEFGPGKLPGCPKGGVYTLETSFSATECSVHGIGAKIGPDSFPPTRLEQFRRNYLQNPFPRRRALAHRRSCIANLKQLDGAKYQWAIDNRKTQDETPLLDELIGNELYLRFAPVCPHGGKYLLGSVGEKPRCTVIGHSLR